MDITLAPMALLSLALACLEHVGAHKTPSSTLLVGEGAFARMPWPW